MDAITTHPLSTIVTLTAWLLILAESVLTGARSWHLRRINARLRDENHELQLACAAYAYQARHDDLTGLPNRRSAYDRLETLLDTQRPVSVVLIDVDGFKLINDAHGHQAGDEALIFLGQRLGATRLPEGSTVARISGDEFAVIVDGGALAARAAAQAVADSLTAAAFIHDKNTIDVSVSIGLAVADDVTCSTADLMRRADHARYHAKGASERIVAWRPEMIMPLSPTFTPPHERRAFRRAR